MPRTTPSANRRRGVALTGSLAAALVLLAGCGSPSGGGGSEQADPDAFTVSLITPGAQGDNSYIDAAVRGLDAAEQSMGVTGQVIEAESTSRQESALRSAVTARPDLVLALGLDPDSLRAVADDNPDQRFGAPSDVNMDELPANVAAYTVNVHEGSFLAGVVAGSLTRTRTVGAVLGIDVPGLNQFFYGYKQGVLAACPGCTVVNSYLGGRFSDPALGKEAALDQIQRGADIVYGVAGLSGTGVIQAAQETGTFAIGVDGNQDDDAPGTVITSVLKRVDRTTELLIEAAKNGTFRSGFTAVGLAQGATGLSWDDGSTTFARTGPADLTAKLPQVRAAVADYKARILDGSIAVCDALGAPTTPQCRSLGVAA